MIEYHRKNFYSMVVVYDVKIFVVLNFASYKKLLQGSVF